MGYKKNDPCLQKAFEDERLFVLMTRDVNAPTTVLEWIKLSFFDQSNDKLREAFECALEMKGRFGEMRKRKIYELEGWIFCTKELPFNESSCDVLYENFEIGKSTFWNKEEGFDGQVEPHHIEVIAWKNAQRTI